MSFRNVSYVNISISMDAYEIANLFAALNLTPDTGDWKAQITNKIQDQMREQGVNPEDFHYPPNSGMNLKGFKKHINMLELHEKHQCLDKQKI